jgi:hypothetical protein
MDILVKLAMLLAMIPQTIRMEQDSIGYGTKQDVHVGQRE